MFIKLLKEHFGKPAGEVIHLDETVGKALIASGLAEEVKEDPLAPLVAKSLEGLLANLTTSLNTTLDAALKEFAQAQSKSRKNKLPALFGDGNTGDPERTFGKFLLAV